MSPQQQQEQTPSIRIVPHIEGPRSLHFDIIEREVPESSIIKIGRFTDKAHVPNRVTFKSKVVSRGHAEIWCENGKFFIRDTKSSSGTFLNHVRLSSPSQESKPHPLKDGDVVQLGVDYQGGTEEIYRCVKMRIELNRSWQRKINHFNLNALKQVKQLTGPDAFKHQTTDCCICLCGIGPFQALFLAPCSHVFHYKCIRPILVSHHPGFLCPLCRSFADLEANIENQVDWEQLLAEEESAAKKDGNVTSTAGGASSVTATCGAAVSTTSERAILHQIDDQNSAVANQTFNRQENDNTNNISEASPIPIVNDNSGVQNNITVISNTTTSSPTNGTSTNTNNNATTTTNLSTQLDKIQINGRLLTAQEKEVLFSALNRIPSLTSPTASTSSTSLTIPIPKNNRKTGNGHEENDENGMLSRTLPSSPPQILNTAGIGTFEDNDSNGGESGSSIKPKLPRTRDRAETLNEIVEEEEEGSMSSSSSGPSERRTREKHPYSAQDVGISSASASDNDEDGLHISVRFCGNDGDNAYSFITSENGQENGFVQVTTWTLALSDLNILSVYLDFNDG
ncbi:2501_t:CDS:2 [Ambispora gerdemannii]|uniref:2501_t:CDS:1 n=1 Tax=Ambispora gerdemannii TaxID=144530 RepID=A0A9N8ZQK8_9GLOM|nr:2501_t:CDS:2 [Ambispora gerdemannii]